jgi:NO-binding membrane sensor protein with MHYT domain
MNPVVQTSYQLGFIAISFGISVLGAFVALNAASRIRGFNGRISWLNTICAGIALGGIGVWSMHFIGMLALKMDMATSYGMIETLISLVAAIAATSLALAFVSKGPEQLGRIMGAGFLLGLGVVVMHYLGMYGMKFGGFIQWNFSVVAISAVIAVVAATAALWLAFNMPTLKLRATASVVMGVAVCSMHYTGMHAAEFICTTANRVAQPQGFGYISSMDLPSMVATVALAMAALISVDQAFQSAGNAAARRRVAQNAAAGSRIKAR